MEKAPVISNYETMKNNMAAVFLQYDQTAMIQKFALKQDVGYLYLCFFARSYRIHRLTGSVTWSEDGFQTETPADYNEAMTIYDVLCNAKKTCRLSHTWVNVGSLSAVQGGSLAKGSSFFQAAGDEFTGKTAMLAAACEAMHGRKQTGGDVAYELDMFSFLPVSLRFWEADEEFPASLQLLADRNILDYIHYETLMFAIAHLLHRLKEEMELKYEQ